MNELRNNIGRKTNNSDAEALSAWRKRVEISRTKAYSNLESRAAKLGDAAEKVRETRYGGARINEVAPIRESTANAIANASDAPEGRSTSVAYKECGEETETTDKGRVKSKSIKKETTSENKKIKSEKREKTEASGNDAETRPKEKKKIKTKSRQPSTLTESSEEEEDAPSRRTSHRKHKGEKRKS